MTTNCEKTETKRRRGPGYLVNPFEIAFRGFRGAGHAGIVDALARDLGRVEARVVDLNSPPGYVRSQDLLDADAVLIRSEQTLDAPQLVFGAEPLTDEANVLAYAGYSGSTAGFEASRGVPYINVESEPAGLRDFVVNYFDGVAKTVPLYGLVLAGGKSTRMERDKAGLAYHGRPQVEYCRELLSKYCGKVFVSNREEQASDAAQYGAPQIHDRFLGYGPMGGILSALKAYPGVAWLVLACDLPYVNEEALDTLLRGRNPFKLATAYISENDGFPEPLCAVYEPKSVFRLLHFLGLGYHCPRKVLSNSDTCLLKQPAAHVMTNVNSPEEYAEAQRVLAETGRGTT